MNTYMHAICIRFDLQLRAKLWCRFASWCCDETGMYDKDVDRWQKRQMEDELRDPRNFLE